MNTPTPRTDSAWAKTFEDDENQCRAGNAATDMRDECATLERELAALAAERDHLHAQLRALTLICGTSDANKFSTWIDRANARAERAEAIVGKLQELHGCSQEMVVHWCEHAANRSLGLDQARSELATEREKSERYRLATLKLDAELAAERARLDWLLSYDGVDWVLSAHKNRKLFEGESDNRALLEAAMKEGAK